MLRYETGYPDWDPFSEMRQLQAEMNRAFGSHGRQQRVSAFPPVNLWTGDSSVAITAEVPGFSQDDIDLQVQENTVTIEGERKRVEGGKDLLGTFGSAATGIFHGRSNCLSA